MRRAHTNRAEWAAGHGSTRETLKPQTRACGRISSRWIVLRCGRIFCVPLYSPVFYVIYDNTTIHTQINKQIDLILFLVVPILCCHLPLFAPFYFFFLMLSLFRISVHLSLLQCFTSTSATCYVSSAY